MATCLNVVKTLVCYVKIDSSIKNYQIIFTPKLFSQNVSSDLVRDQVRNDKAIFQSGERGRILYQLYIFVE